MENVQRDVILVLGRTGSGKTTWSRNYVRGLSRVIVADADFREYDALDFPEFSGFIDYLKPRASTASIFRVSYTPYVAEYPLMFDIARICGPCHLVLEEADRFDDPRYCLEYEEIVARGRHHRVSLVAVSRYPYALPSMLRREASRIIAFHHHEPTDLGWFSEVMGPDADILPDLKEHEFIDWTPGRPPGELIPQRLDLTGRVDGPIIKTVKK